MNQSAAEIVCEYGPFPGVESVAGVTYDGQQVWFAAGDKLIALDPVNGKTLRSIVVAASAGTAFDGRHLFQIADGRIQKIDPTTGRCSPPSRRPTATVTQGSPGPKGRSGWGTIRIERSIKSIPKPGRSFAPSSRAASLPESPGSIGQLWHGTWVDDESDLRRIDPRTGEVLEMIAMPSGAGVSGLESDGGDQFFCGGGSTGKLRIVRRPRRGSVATSGSKIHAESASR